MSIGQGRDPYAPPAGPIKARLRDAAEERRALAGPSEPPASMSLGEHIEELRTRVIYALAGLVVLLAVSLFFGRGLLDHLLAPVRAELFRAGLPGRMTTTGLGEYFAMYFKVSLVAAVLVGGPWILYQLWRFIAPGLYSYERRFAYVLLPMSITLSAVGGVFMFFVVFPLLVKFFITFSVGPIVMPQTPMELPPGVVLPALPVLEADPVNPPLGSSWLNSTRREICYALPGNDDGKVLVYSTPLGRSTDLTMMPRAVEVIEMLMGLALVFAVAFQTPVVVLLLGWIGAIDQKVIGKYRKHVLMAIVVLAAVGSPGGDPISMLLLCGPIYGLFEFGVLLLRLLPAKRMLKETNGEAFDGDEVEPNGMGGAAGNDKALALESSGTERGESTGVGTR